jgi:hypothetical protein
MEARILLTNSLVTQSSYLIRLFPSTGNSFAAPKINKEEADLAA